MRKLTLGLFVANLIPCLMFAQPSDEHRGQGYVFFAPGFSSVSGLGTTGTAQVGGGAEGLVYKGLGVGAELGYLTPWRAFGDGIGVFSPDVSFHFLPRRREGKVVPFVNGGYTLLFRSGHANGLNFGGGVNYWFRDHVGLRLEFRDQVQLQGITVHYVGFRVGLVFR